MDTQVPVIDGKSNIATLTVGGNDIGFGDAANACVFKVNRTPDCGEKLTSTGNRIANDLPPKMDSLLTAIMNKAKNPGFKLYVTGYPHFWNVDTAQCDDADFNLWADTTPKKLIQDLRTRMNGLTQALNDQIQTSPLTLWTIQCLTQVYVDVSPTYNGHRYCDIGIQEPDPKIANPNEQRWFHENWLFQQNLEFSGSSDAIQWQTWAEQQLAIDLSLTVNNFFTQHGTGNGNGASNGVGLNIMSNTSLFDGLNRAFHPTVDGQDSIKNVLLAAYQAHPPNGAGLALIL